MLEAGMFVDNGYEQTTVAQIADRAGMNRATFFRLSA
jgi:AcrR family transcriptional regulator